MKELLAAPILLIFLHLLHVSGNLKIIERNQEIVEKIQNLGRMKTKENERITSTLSFANDDSDFNESTDLASVFDTTGKPLKDRVYPDELALTRSRNDIKGSTPAKQPVAPQTDPQNPPVRSRRLGDSDTPSKLMLTDGLSDKVVQHAISFVQPSESLPPANTNSGTQAKNPDYSAGVVAYIMSDSAKATADRQVADIGQVPSMVENIVNKVMSKFGP